MKNRHWLPYSVFGVLAGAIFLLVQMPARYLVSMLGDTSPLQLQATSGKLLAGRVEQLRFGPRLIGSLQWDWIPWRLLFGRVVFQLTLLQDDSYLRGRLEIPLAHDGWSLDEVDVDADVGIATDWLGGRLQGTLNELDWRGDAVTLQGDLLWLQAESPLLPGVRAGGMALRAGGGNEAVITTLPDYPADLGLEGQIGFLSKRIQYQVVLSATTRQGEKALSALGSLGRQQPDGGVLLDGELAIF